MGNSDLISQLEKIISEKNKEQTEQLSKKIKEVTDSTTEIKEVLSSQCEKISSLEKKIAQLEEQNRKIDRLSRKNNLVIFKAGYSEGDVFEFTKDFLNSKLGLCLDASVFDNVFLIGKDDQDVKSRPLVVKFVSFIVKKAVLKNCYKLKNTGIGITEDLSTRDREERRVLVQHLKIARDNQKKAYIRGTKLYIEGKAHTCEDFVDNKLITQEAKSQPENCPKKHSHTSAVKQDTRSLRNRTNSTK